MLCIDQRLNLHQYHKWSMKADTVEQSLEIRSRYLQYDALIPIKTRHLLPFSSLLLHAWKTGLNKHDNNWHHHSPPCMPLIFHSCSRIILEYMKILIFFPYFSTASHCHKLLSTVSFTFNYNNIGHEPSC